MIFSDEAALIAYLKTIPNEIKVSFRSLPDGRFEFTYKALKENNETYPNSNP